ncbi:MAG: glutamyl-tRNA amidotransferase [Candidatus Yonathbacteria bacterium CG_4_10_14_3_um_filter_47_65]|uniref:Glutamyl-tRNA amidotransferase n=2 Tax=Parcubacteria group TaxID=1794811 RepID=A0A2M8D7X5_9BACT|nr:MAG: hypothetical protein AUJ44_01555 [Candidatus Nomurabacteria bacterium CG1_02_47_685]PIP03611.1 MAG: glutamyl-tRNA amidotransferase [Candidatus Yonathbacteria bacterium CG23_combo_of_CG06-09_8_20_14_all_46_18]PIQ31978.1 MAG: glutamyl-tRNA amidotransferase [Candidatus Yonathbacteria bacterium CG17_big_fil_post_rev_8_21_14_2_50_46_19]PIX56726.1 MAG: glutamyl-tRNA amidotransferase [Candidatus Yonathbacteria bacterium CG_4_10_14_3_um_filter_47_65]PIY57537.1 MAG: glutamyl-tRNA amidotransferas
MNTIHETIKEEIKKAMLAKDTIRLGVLRRILAAFINELVAKKRTPQEILEDDAAETVIKRMAKQHKDSIEQFEAGGRNDLVESERAELACLEAYLPKMMSKEEIATVAKRKKEELRADDKAKIGILIGVIMKELRGRADGNDVKEVVEKLFD